MIVEASLGLAAGLLLAGSLADLRQVRHRVRTVRIITLVGITLSITGIGLELVNSISNGSAPFSLTPETVLIFIALGGAAYTFQTKSSPFILLTGGLLLAYATFVSMHSASFPRSDLARIYLAVASACTLPTLHASVLKWRKLSAPIFPVREMWLVATIAFVLYASMSLIERGAWLGSSAGEVWALAAWIASSGAVLTQDDRPRASLLFASALAIAFSALST